MRKSHITKADGKKTGKKNPFIKCKNGQNSSTSIRSQDAEFLWGGGKVTTGREYKGSL